MATYINADGLPWNLGLDEAKKANIGAYTNFGPVHQLEVLVKYDELPAVADAQVILDDAFTIPAGALIEEVQIMTPTTAVDSAGDALTFCLGVINQDRTSNPDTDFFIVDATQAEINGSGVNATEGSINSADWVGAGVSAVTAYNYLITWEVNAAAATAGQFTVRIRWSFPPKNSDTLAYTKS
jgi:hypothetical protein